MYNYKRKRNKGDVVSNLVNEALIEEAWDYINSGDLSSTPMEKMLEEDIKNYDMEALWAHLVQAREFLRTEMGLG